MKTEGSKRNADLTTVIILSISLVSGCSAPVRTLFGKRTPHEAYERKIEDAGLRSTALGIAWLRASQRALQQPVRIGLPYKETAWFAAETPDAYGYIFFIRRGEVVNISITANDSASWLLFADLWRKPLNASAELLSAADTVNHTIRYEASRDDSCILRVQPELLKNGGYTVTIISAPTLAFPVPTETQPKIGSIWGDARDAGARSHEGIDIFGKLRTPVVAAADGYITRVGENNLGGKIIFLQPDGRNYNLYYAHLDSQTVREGQYVKAGEIIGLMGNTGNARYTATHLHFGIYTTGGAVDPLPFVNNKTKQPKAITTATEALNNYVRNAGSTSAFASPENRNNIIEKLLAGSVFRVTGITGDMYKIELPEKRQAFVASRAVTIAQKPIRTIRVDKATILLAEAQSLSPGKKQLVEGSNVEVFGLYKDFYFVAANGVRGWIKK